ncbi:MAG: hypothetical protein M5U34_41870 [Chloroflexi bacterium]|nr:hypothetical protein [Chloroflexota bacterium]
MTTYLRPFSKRVILLTILLLIGIGLQLFAPQVIRRFPRLRRSYRTSK